MQNIVLNLRIGHFPHSLRLEMFSHILVVAFDFGEHLLASSGFYRFHLLQCLLLLFGSVSVESSVLLEPRTMLFPHLNEVLDPNIPSF